VVLHTTWGGQVNRPFAYALAAAWEERYGTRLEATHDDDALGLELPHEVDTDELLELVAPDRLLALLRKRLESSGFFGARFRENAGRALLLPRGDQRHRVPLWLNRQRSKKLLDAVARYPDFPLVLETWRTCLQDEMDLETLRQLLGELDRGEIEVLEVTTAKASPFATGLGWKQTNRLMYEDDTPEGGASRLGDDLLAEVALAGALRPRVPASLVEELRRKLQRTWPGYAPPPDELADWVRERVAMGLDEWRELLEAVRRDGGLQPEEVAAAVAGAAPRAIVARLGASEPLVVAIEALPRLQAALVVADDALSLAPLDRPETPLALAEAAALLATARHAAPAREEDAATLASTLLGEWLRFHGPVARNVIGATWDLDEAHLLPLLDDLVDAEQLVAGEIVLGADEVQLCDAENLVRLLRMLRASTRPQLAPLPLARLPLFLAVQQGLAPRKDGIEGLQTALERLFGWAAPAALWETDLLPARLEPYHPAWLDTLLEETDLLWTGNGRERLTFCFPEDLRLVREGAAGSETPEEERGASDLEVEAAPDDGDGRRHAGESRDAERGAVDDGAAGGEMEATAPSPRPTSPLFPGPGRFTLPELLPHAGGDTARLTARLWSAAWAGEVTNDTFAAVRKGVLGRFRASAVESAQPAPGLTGGRLAVGGIGRRGFERWRSTRAFTGRWYALPATEPDEDPLAREELHKDRARLLLQRYGVVFRELCLRETPGFAWRHVFRALRLMELAGEVAMGAFFTGIPGPQFASPAAIRRLRRELPEDAVWWVSALDPAAPCGLALEELRGNVPRRAAGTHLVYQGSTLVLVSEGRARRLHFDVTPDHPRLADYFEVLKVQLTRSFAPWRSLEVQEINGEAAAQSPYAAALAARFQVSSTASGLRLWRRY
jgi:ATP-dependent Lhr-like helicase